VAGAKRWSWGGTYGGGVSEKLEVEDIILGVNFDVILEILYLIGYILAIIYIGY